MLVGINSFKMDITVPDGYALVQIDGDLVCEDNHILIINEQDRSQLWWPLPSQQSATSAEEQEEEEVSIEDSDARISDANNKTDKKKDWSEEDTVIFIELLEKHKKELDDPKLKKKTVFALIATEMRNIIPDEKVSPTIQQCENRYKSLLKKFKEVTDHNSRTGNDRKDWKYYELMQNFFGERPNVEPVAGCSSLNLAKEISLKGSLKEKLSGIASKRKSADDTVVKKKKSKVRSELLTVIEKIEENAERRDNQRMEVMKAQHNDIKSFMDKVLEAINKKNQD